MNQHKPKFAWTWLVIVVGIMFLAGCSAPKPKPGESFTCAKASDINLTIAPEASLEDFSCVLKPWEGEDTLHFKVAVKNISAEEQRFKVNIFLENGKAVGGLLPDKTKNGLMKPGQALEFEYPVKGVTGYPGKIDLLIKTLSK